MPVKQLWIRRAIAALVIIAPVIRYLSHDLPLFFIANADMLAVPALAESVQRHGPSAVGDWYWPPAPYVLTDVLPYGLIWLGLPNVWLAPAIFMAGQLLVLLFALRWFARALFSDDADDRQRDRAEWGALASFALFVALAVALVDPARFVLVSYYRAGSFILTVVALGLVLRWVGRGRPDDRWWVAVAVLAVTAFAVLSDPLLIPAAAGPLLVVFAALALIPRDRNGWRDDWPLVLRHSAAIVLGVGVGVVLNGLLVTDESTYGPSLTGGSMRAQARMILGLFDDTSLTLVFFALAAVAVLGLAVVRAGLGRVSTLGVVAAFWVVSSGAHVTAMMLDTSEPALRYVQVVALLPLVWLGPIAAQWLHQVLSSSTEERGSAPRWPAPRWLAPRWLAPCAVAGLAVVPALVVVAPAVGELGKIDGDYQAPEAACLDQVVPADGVGVSGYWEARLIQLHSNYERDLAPLDGAGEPMRINASSEWFDQDYDFAVVGTQTPGWDLPLTLMEVLAPGARLSECGTLLILDAGRGGLRLEVLTETDGSVSFTGCDLGTVVGTLDESSCTIDVPEGSAGFASFGGYVSLEPGDYDIELAYSSDAPSDTKLGTVEITRVRKRGGEVEVVLSAPLFGPSSPGPASLDLDVLVPDDGEGFIVELRTVTDGTNDYQVESVTITRR